MTLLPLNFSCYTPGYTYTLNTLTGDAPAVGDIPSLKNKHAEKLKLFCLQMALKNTDNYLPGNPLNGIQCEHNGHYRDY